MRNEYFRFVQEECNDESFYVKCPNCPHSDIFKIKKEVIHGTPNYIHQQRKPIYCKICDMYFDGYNALFLDLLSIAEPPVSAGRK